MKEEKPTILDREEKNKAEEKTHTWGTSNVTKKEVPIWQYMRIDIPELVTDCLGLKEGDRINFIEENDRIYIKKVQE